MQVPQTLKLQADGLFENASVAVTLDGVTHKDVRFQHDTTKEQFLTMVSPFGNLG